MPRASILFATLAVTSLAHAGGFRLQVDNDHGRVAASAVYRGFGCTGDNRAPGVQWEGAPAGTRSFALTTRDPDAPTGSGWWHWVVVDLPAAAHALPAGGALPRGAVDMRNDYGRTGWGGPCPPAGDAPHHYVFTIYALDVPRLDLPADASAAMTGFAIHGHVIGKATATLEYGR